MNWRTTDRFPLVQSDGWHATNGNAGRCIRGQEAVEKAMRLWHPLHPLLIAVPGAARLLPPLAIAEIKEKIHRTFLLRSRLSIEIVILAAVVSALFAQSDRVKDAREIATLLVGLAAFLVLDYFFVFRRMDAITERTLFASWVREKARWDCVFWSALMLLAGALQMVAQGAFGGFDPLVEKYGVSFPALEQGEVWRLLYGPFIHLNLMHWATNSILLVFVAMIGATISRSHTIAAFLIGSAIGGAITFLTGRELFSSYVGVSAGVMALLGMCAGAAKRNPSQFPIRFAFTFTTFGLMNLLLALIYSPDAANIAHATGFAVGLIWGMAIQMRKGDVPPTGKISLRPQRSQPTPPERQTPAIAVAPGRSA